MSNEKREHDWKMIQELYLIENSLDFNKHELAGKMSEALTQIKNRLRELHHIEQVYEESQK